MNLMIETTLLPNWVDSDELNLHKEVEFNQTQAILNKFIPNMA